MVERTTAKELRVQSSVERKFNLLIKLIFGTSVLGVTIAGGGFLLRADLREIKAVVATTDERVDALRRDVTAMQDRIGALEKNTQAIQVALTQIRDKLSSSNPSPIQPLALTSVEEQTIRAFFGINKGSSPQAPQYAIGDVLPDPMPLPDFLATRFPRLRGLRYARDPGNDAVLIADVAGRVITIIMPA